MLSRRGVLAALAAPAVGGQEPGTRMFGDAEACERFMGRWSRPLAPLLVAFTDMHDAGRVLDVGAGTGALAHSIARLKIHCQVLGIDPSKEYVAFARSRNRFAGRIAKADVPEKINIPGAVARQATDFEMPQATARWLESISRWQPA
jgi:SAM-dependent methyltransferase